MKTYTVLIQDDTCEIPDSYIVRADDKLAAEVDAQVQAAHDYINACEIDYREHYETLSDMIEDIYTDFTVVAVLVGEVRQA